ncbi:MAG: dockerin type I repeat-containing protein, partial [Nitrososphaerota archaeon]
FTSGSLKIIIDGGLASGFERANLTLKTMRDGIPVSEKVLEFNINRGYTIEYEVQINEEGEISEKSVFKTLTGDLNHNGILDVGDAVLALRYTVGLEKPAWTDVLTGDINGNSMIDVGDAVLILRKVVGLS